MKVTISPSVAKGSITAPPSKSVAHRALICGALSKGSTIRNIVDSQDVEATLRCLKAMGATVQRNEDHVFVGGLDPFHIPAETLLDCGESASTLRFLLPLCLLSSVPVHLTGSERLLERPLDVYERLCRDGNLTFVHTKRAITVCGPLSAGEYCVRGDVSSQFITGLLFTLSLLDGESTIIIKEPFESRSYVTLTQRIQSDFGVSVRIEGNTRIGIYGNGKYRAQEYCVEGDYSNAAFLDAFNLLDGRVKVMGLSRESAQGDTVYKNFYDRFSASDRHFDLSDCPDLGPVMFALSAALGGAEFSGTARLRIKESDRVAAMVQELEKFGVFATVAENSVKIHPAVLHTPTQVLCGHNDHRIVMALSLLCSKVGGTIEGAEAVAKSYPDYFDAIRSLGIDVAIWEVL